MIAPIKSLAENLLGKPRALKIIDDYKEYEAEKFINQIFDDFDMSYSVSEKDFAKIPSEGRVIIYANHPQGMLDGLLLLKLILRVRKDVKILANEMLNQIPQLKKYFIPINLSSHAAKEPLLNAVNHLKNEGAIVIFPAGVVSRMNVNGIVDGKWGRGISFIAEKSAADLLPVFIKGKNSAFFYFASLINKNISTSLLINELFNKRGKTIELTIGNPFSCEVLRGFTNKKYPVKFLKKHLYRIGKGKAGIFISQKPIIHPADVKLVRKELFNSQQLGETSDGKIIFLTNYDSSMNALTELARLREISFRKIGEGTGKSCDLDKFDKYYHHIILWDDKQLEIVGAYRIGIGKEIISAYGIDGFYSSTLFQLNESKNNFEECVELGRSFIHPKYWNTSALDSLWQGIGAFLRNFPHIKHLFGPVSISGRFPNEAKELIVYYYGKWFAAADGGALSGKNEFQISPSRREVLSNFFTGQNYQSDFLILKKALKNFGFAVPPLLKKYTELTEFGGSKFLGFNIDDSFNSCVDALIFVDVEKIKSEKRKRYLELKLNKQTCENYFNLPALPKTILTTAGKIHHVTSLTEFSA